MQYGITSQHGVANDKGYVPASASIRSYDLLIDNKQKNLTESYIPKIFCPSQFHNAITSYNLSGLTATNSTIFDIRSVLNNSFTNLISSNLTVPDSNLVISPEPSLCEGTTSECQHQACNFSYQAPPQFNPILRVTSPPTTILQYPTPVLQILLGAYVGKIEQLERTGELLSMTPHLEDAIKNLNVEQRCSEKQHPTSSQVSPTKSHHVSNSCTFSEYNGSACSQKASISDFNISPLSSPDRLWNERNDNPSENAKLDSALEKRLSNSFVKEYPSKESASSQPHTNQSLDLKYDSISASKFQSHTTENIPSHDIKSCGIVKRQGQEKSKISDKDLSPGEVMEKLFEDFDGSYLEQNPPDESNSNLSNKSPLIAILNRPQRHLSESQISIPIAGISQKSHADPETGDQMVYYPAPVPSILNLPPRLSKKSPSALQNTKKLQMMSANNNSQGLINIQSDQVKPKTEASIGGKESLSPQLMNNALNTSRLRSNRDLTSLPSHIRASNFFEKLNQTQEVIKLKDQSAVATLESILDASAHAPVHAFTDHTFAGTLGPEVYGRKEIPKICREAPQNEKLKSKRSSSFLFLGGRNCKSKETIDACQDQGESSEQNLRLLNHDNFNPNDKDTTAVLGSTADKNNLDETPVGDSKVDELSSDGEYDDEIYQGPPTTLLAELQIRKQRQKQRTQPLTKTFPNGIHSTLLELDTAIQTEQKSRRKGRTVLAWEGPTALEAQEAIEDNDDVPLAMLYPDKTNDNHPLSLLEQRALEDNEPLSQRRCRLQGQASIANRQGKSTSNIILANEPEEEETLRERLKRLKLVASPQVPIVTDDFESQIFEHLENNLSDTVRKTDKKKMGSSKIPEEEETLGQRRKRLQAVQGSGAREIDGNLQMQQHILMPNLKSRKSVSGILSAHPIGSGKAPPHYEKPTTGLLALHEKHAALRSASMLSLNKIPASFGPNHAQQRSLNSFRDELHNEDYTGNMASKSTHNLTNQINAPNLLQNYTGNPAAGHSWGGGPELSTGLGIKNINHGIPTHLQGYMQNISMMPMNMASPQPIKPGQVDMIERWRHSIMPLNKPTT